MPIDPNLGYDPYAGGGFGPSNIDEWAYDFAMTFANKYANGTVGEYGGPGGILSDAVAGFKLTPGEGGSGIFSPNTFNQLLNYGKKIASNPGAYNLTGLADPTGLGNTRNLGQADKNNIFSGTQQEKDRLTQMAIANLQEAGASARNAADIAARLSIAQLQEAGASARNAAQILSNEKIAGIESADRRYGIDVTAAVNREDIAARERMAAADRTSREGIASADRAESGRQFDLGLAEDRRQFNSTLMMGLLDRGIELAKAPVDWIGYQYWLGTIGAAVDVMSLTSAAAVFGAIPPSGPSAAGPVVGGPAVMDGDMQLAQSLGVTGGPVTVEQAIAEHPGGTVNAASQDGAAVNTVASFGGAAAVDAQLAQARQSELPTAGVDPSFLQSSQQVSQQVQATSLASQIPQTAGQMAAPPPLPATQVQAPATAVPPPPTPPSVYAAPLTNVSGATPGAVGGIYTGNEQGSAAGAGVGAATTAGQPQAAQGGLQMSAPVDNLAQPDQAAASQPQGSTANIDQLLAQLSQSSGIPVETLRRLFPANLMTPQYSADVINNSPVIQALRGNAELSAFNTGSTTGPFTNIRATGTNLGIRGGQDVNATQFLSANPGAQQMMQGAIRATGQYFPDFQQQMLRSAPLTNLATGSTGQRRW